MNCDNNSEPIFQQLESRILLSGSPMPENIDAEVVSVDLSESQAVEQNQFVTEILFIDANVTNYGDLLSSLNRNVEVYVIGAEENGINKITSTLDGREDISAIHIISHGSAGEISLGSVKLTSQNLVSYQTTLNTWGESLTADADILIYGCNVGQDSDFVTDFANYTSADVAASDDLTGAASLDGDAELESQQGVVEATEIFEQEAYNLTNVVLTTPPDPTVTYDQYEGAPYLIAFHFTETQRQSDASFDAFFSYNAADYTSDASYVIYETGGNNYGLAIYLERSNSGANFELKVLHKSTSSNVTTLAADITSLSGQTIAAALTIDLDSELKLFVNGSLAATAAMNASTWTGTGDIGIGGINQNSALDSEVAGSITNFIGEIPLVNYYDAILSDAEVLALANNPPTITSSTVPSPAVTYNQYEGTPYLITSHFTTTQRQSNASFDLLFSYDAADYTSDASYVIYEAGGDLHGLTIYLERSNSGANFELKALVKNGDSNATTLATDITSLSGEAIAAALTIDLNLELKLFINGSLIEIAAIDKASWTGPGDIGIGGFNGTNSLNNETTGTIADFIGEIAVINYYDTLLTSTQVFALVNQKPALAPIPVISANADVLNTAQDLVLPTTVFPSDASKVETNFGNLGQAWVYDGTTSTEIRAFGGLGYTDQDASLDLWFKVDQSIPINDSLIYETGGSTTGTTIWVHKNAADDTYTLKAFVMYNTSSEYVVEADITSQVLAGSYINASLLIDVDSSNGFTELYVDGLLEQTSTTGNLSSWGESDHSAIGGLFSEASAAGEGVTDSSGTAGFNNFMGEIAEVNFFDSKLTSGEVSYLYYAKAGISQTSVTFTENDTNTYADVTAADLTLYNLEASEPISTITITATNIQDSEEQLVIDLDGSGGGAATSIDLTTDANSGGVQVVYSGTTSTISLTGPWTLATAQEVLRSIKYNHSSQDPTDGDRSFTLSVTDAGGLTSDPFAVNIVNVDPLNDAPAITLTPSGAITEGNVDTSTAVGMDPDTDSFISTGIAILGQADISVYQSDSLRSLLTTNGFQSNFEFSTDDVLSVVPRTFEQTTEKKEKIVDAGEFNHEVKDKNSYDTSMLSPEEQQFILNLSDPGTEENGEDEASEDEADNSSFDSSNESLYNTLKQEKSQDRPLTQYDLDLSIDLSASLAGEFDCLNGHHEF